MDCLCLVTVLPAVGRDLIDYLTLVISTCLLAVGFFGVRYARRTLRIIERQTKASEGASTAAKDSAEASLKTAESFIHAERSWILAELGWYDNVAGRMFYGASREGNGEQIYSTTVNVKLTCKNEGRSPAWIDNIYARADIVSDGDQIKMYEKEACQSFGRTEPIAVGREVSQVLTLDCDGRIEEGQFMSIYVIVAYHDIFSLPRTTTMGYSVIPPGEMFRQYALPEHNKNT